MHVMLQRLAWRAARSDADRAHPDKRAPLVGERRDPLQLAIDHMTLPLFHNGRVLCIGRDPRVYELAALALRNGAAHAVIGVVRERDDSETLRTERPDRPPLRTVSADVLVDVALHEQLHRVSPVADPGLGAEVDGARRARVTVVEGGVAAAVRFVREYDSGHAAGVLVSQLLEYAGVEERVADSVDAITDRRAREHMSSEEARARADELVLDALAGLLEPNSVLAFAVPARAGHAMLLWPRMRVYDACGLRRLVAQRRHARWSVLAVSPCEQARAVLAPAPPADPAALLGVGDGFAPVAVLLHAQRSETSRATTTRSAAADALDVAHVPCA